MERLLKNIVWTQLGVIKDKVSQLTDTQNGIRRHGGILSVARHNCFGRGVMEAVLHNSFENVNALLDGNEIITLKYGVIHYYDDVDIVK
ncbi:MAG: hypothetical protein K2N73_13720 [Lachnospiraceae bacterium]|nr:hypothetical protein [Lachnospiraceae bacterium]